MVPEAQAFSQEMVEEVNYPIVGNFTALFRVVRNPNPDRSVTGSVFTLPAFPRTVPSLF